MAISIAIVDDSPLAVAGLVNMLQAFGGDFLITGSYATGAALIAALENDVPDVLLIDIKLPDVSGDALAEKLTRLFPLLKMIALTSYDAPTYIKIMMKAGCKGYLLKTTDLNTIVEAIKRVSVGEEFIDPVLQKQIVQNLYSFRKDQESTVIITKREQEVLALIILEMTNQEIAEKLFLSLRTVEKHRMSLLHKLGAKNTAGLVKNAIELGYYKKE